MGQKSIDLGLVVGAKVKRLIKEAGMTQEDFAWEFGVDERTVRRWTGKGLYDLRSIQMIADFFKVDVWAILSE